MDETLSEADAFVVTSVSAKTLFESMSAACRSKGCQVIPHGRDFHMIEPIDGETDCHARVLVPGNISVAKGANLIAGLTLIDRKIEFELDFLGRVSATIPQNAGVFHGEYDRADFGLHVARIRPTIALVLSIWPETYCHTLTECWAAGIPVVAIDMGAVGERLRQHGGGWLLPPSATAADVHDAIVLALTRADELEQKRREVRAWQVGYGARRSIAAMAADYSALYERTLAQRQIFRESCRTERTA